MDIQEYQQKTEEAFARASSAKEVIEGIEAHENVSEVRTELLASIDAQLRNQVNSYTQDFIAGESTITNLTTEPLNIQA